MLEKSLETIKKSDQNVKRQSKLTDMSMFVECISFLKILLLFCNFVTIL